MVTPPLPALISTPPPAVVALICTASAAASAPVMTIDPAVEFTVMSKAPVVVKLTTPAGFIWEIPAQVVATARANHYASDPDSSFQEEFDYAMSDGGESDLVDWLHGNMDWDDVKPFAELVHKPEIQEPVIGQGVTAVAIKGKDA